MPMIMETAESLGLVNDENRELISSLQGAVTAVGGFIFAMNTATAATAFRKVGGGLSNAANFVGGRMPRTGGFLGKLGDKFSAAGQTRGMRMSAHRANIKAGMSAADSRKLITNTAKLGGKFKMLLGAAGVLGVGLTMAGNAVEKHFLDKIEKTGGSDSRNRWM